MFNSVYSGKRVLVTGHTGFKGSWLSLWLQKLGAHVGGVSLSVPTTPSHYELTGAGAGLKFESFQDIRDLTSLKKVFDEFQPEIVFHLAAEAIVSTCFENPTVAFGTNLGGTVNILECLRTSKSVRSVVMITSDKAYENVEWDYGYRETDRLGGKDPYSASKACAEIAISAYFRSYMATHETLRIASARAGNVIGGGDFAKDRIVPDCIRAIMAGAKAQIRSPLSTRPWQLVLEPLSGYLKLGSDLYKESTKMTLLNKINGESFNFGPPSEVEVTVGDLLANMNQRWSKFGWTADTNNKLATKEAGLLKLNCDKALRRLQWQPVLSFSETIDFLTDWYREWYEEKTNVSTLSLSQLERYETLAKQRELPWTL
jgi:CDP-glucose 4,6-dehydratase